MMIAVALAQVEDELDVRLPPEVGREMADPAVHEAFRRIMLDANPTLAPDEELADTAGMLIAATRSFRGGMQWLGWDSEMPHGLSGAYAAPERPWPHEWLVLGGDFNGNAYFLDLSRDPGPVAFWDPESRTCRLDRVSFVAWADAYRACGREYLRTKPPPLPRNPSCPNCGAELTAARTRVCRNCGARF